MWGKLEEIADMVIVAVVLLLLVFCSFLLIAYLIKQGVFLALLVVIGILLFVYKVVRWSYRVVYHRDCSLFKDEYEE